MFRYSLITIGLLTCLPGAALSGSSAYDWCVDNDQDETLFDCSEFGTCSNATPFSTIQEALSAAAQQGDGGSHRICIRSTAPHTESFVVDNSAGALGERIRLEFRMTADTSYCPAGSGDPAITVIGGGPSPTEVTIFTAWSDFSGCAADQRDADFLMATDARVEVANARLANLEGSFAVTAGDASVTLVRSRLERFQGVLERGSGEFEADDSEISGFRSTSGPVADGSDGRIVLGNSAFFGNIVEGGYPMLVLGPRSELRRSLVGANVVLDGGSLISFTLGGNGDSAEIIGGELTRNTLLGPGVAEPGPLLAPVEPLLPQGDFCLNSGSQGEDYVTRADLVASGDPTTAPLIRFTASGGSIGARATVARTFIVENISDGMFEVEGTGESAQLALLHNTFDSYDGPLVGGGAGTDLRLVAARNLHSKVPTYDLDETLSRVELTMEAMPAPALEWGEAVAELGIVGPPLRYTAGTFESLAEVVSWDSCTRVMATCPEITGCEGLEAGGFDQDCALDRARSWYPDPVLSAQIRIDWPWETDFFPPGAEALSTAGATGWSCSLLASPYDVLDEAGNPGDGDGFSTLTDCDDGDDQVVPSLPIENGISTDACTEVGDDCYVCPDGTATSGDDDDDSGAVCASGDPACVQPGCHGCGVAIVPGAPLVLGLLVGGPWLRVRRRRSAA